MSFGETAFLGLVLGGFVTFIGCVGFISIWSGKRRPLPLARESARVEFRKAA